MELAPPLRLSVTVTAAPFVSPWKPSHLLKLNWQDLGCGSEDSRVELRSSLGPEGCPSYGVVTSESILPQVAGSPLFSLDGKALTA